MTRRSSSSSGARWAPGRVDSPPTSMMSAPWLASSRPCAMALSGSSQVPPSEKESGVTLMTPMTRQRSPAGSPGMRGPEAEASRPSGSCAAAVIAANLRAHAGTGPAGIPSPSNSARTGPGFGVRRHPRAARVPQTRHNGQHLAWACIAPERTLQPPPEPHQAEFPGDPADLDRWPHQERLGFERGEADPQRVPGTGEHQESRHPLRAELGIELIQRLDLEPSRQEQQEPAPSPRYRPGTDALAPCQRSAEHREVQRNPLHAEVASSLNCLDDQE